MWLEFYLNMMYFVIISPLFRQLCLNAWINWNSKETYLRGDFIYFVTTGRSRLPTPRNRGLSRLPRDNNDNNNGNDRDYFDLYAEKYDLGSIHNLAWNNHKYSDKFDQVKLMAILRIWDAATNEIIYLILSELIVINLELRQKKSHFVYGQCWEEKVLAILWTTH